VPATSDRWLSGFVLGGVARGKGASNPGSLDRKDSESIPVSYKTKIPQGSNRR
jgi:hypothetical protein